MSTTSDALSPTVHLIDDDEAVRESLALLIGTVGLRVVTWADPRAFLAGFEREGIGAIVLDVRMPGISGLSVLDTLVAEGVDQPVIMLTGHGTVDMCRRAFKAGAAEFLEKPVDDEALIELGFDLRARVADELDAFGPGLRLEVGDHRAHEFWDICFRHARNYPAGHCKSPGN